MNNERQVLFSWSGGKDSSLALHEIQKNQKYEITALITTVTADYDRVSMHGLRTSLLEEQARNLDIPLQKVLISKNASNDEYESKFNEVLLKYKESGISQIVFGDLFLEEINDLPPYNRPIS
jgi:diphthamide synthase (EF-2-diphthine--ammonia ligase)